MLLSTPHTCPAPPPQHPAIRKLAWWSVLGNHDLVGSSTDVEIGYSRRNPQWVLPARYWGQDVRLGRPGTRVQPVTLSLTFINTSPFITEYSQPCHRWA